MEDKKFVGGICPKCFEPYATQQFAKIALGSGAQINMTCEQGHMWTEFYNLCYQGFWWNGQKYDTYSDPIINQN